MLKVTAFSYLMKRRDMGKPEVRVNGLAHGAAHVSRAKTKQLQHNEGRVRDERWEEAKSPGPREQSRKLSRQGLTNSPAACFVG